ncbi:MAG TPA: chromosome segregation protein SMC [Ignavibacteriaceae bacterium]|nr:chromosome segregation protein SMC [Ignavibacteriaceae bacterium]
MYLSRLEILGFKSFAQKTSISFNEGVTSIVGPNGCGKTNIVDSIRWVLGEQRSGTLRSDKMENIIFNGTGVRKPMGMAEVSLSIHNNKGILPTEYTDVTITRRIFRSGESEYLLNKNICRLKDIINLFMDTGIGANAYSVIELKMVETILSNKADERRTMFEEAAGVNKYKLRRRLALRKLDEVKADLTRVNDIVTEVEKKVNSLERQAKRADKYNRVSSSLRELELDLAEREFALYHLHKDEAAHAKEENLQKKISHESELSELTDQLKIIKKRLTEAENALKNKRAEVTSKTESIHKVENHLSISKERKTSLERNIERYKEELVELSVQLEETEKLIFENTGLISTLENDIQNKEKEKTETAGKIDEIRNLFESKKNNLKDHSELQLEKFKEITAKENDFSNLEKILDNKNLAINKLNQKIQSFTGNIAKTVGFIEDLSQDKLELERKLNESEEIYSKKQKEKEDLEKELGSLKDRELENKTYLNTLKEKISFIQTLVENLEGVSKGSKALLENKEWAKGEKNLLAHLGNTNDEFRFAVEAALRGDINNILVESIDDLLNGIEFLNDNEFGKASFYLKDLHSNSKKSFIDKLKNYSVKLKKKSLAKESGFVNWAYEVIQSDSRWESFFNLLLNRTAIVENIKSAFKLSDKYPDFNFATLNGDFISSTGLIEAGSAIKLDDSLFGRMKLLENLKNELPLKEKELEKLQEKINSTEEKINSIDLKVLSEQGRMIVNDLSNVEKQISQFEFEKTKAVDEIEKARTEIAELADESNRLDTDKNILADLLSEQLEEKRKADEKRENLESGVRQAEEDLGDILKIQNRLNLELERLLGEKKNSENALSRDRESTETINKTITKRENDISEFQEEIRALNLLIEDSTVEIDQLKVEKSVLIRDEEELNSAYKLIQNQINELEEKQNIVRKEREQVSDNIHESEIKINELRINLKNLEELIQENYSLKLELKKFDDLELFDFKTKTEEVHSLKQQIKNLGPINLLAYSEFEEEKQRLEFLTKQRNDLIESEKDVIKTIEEINTTAQQLFKETFDKIRDNFINIFRGLFNPGDEADLRIEENADPLEAKIEIIAKPKGKRPTSIDLLSGGEKTLTAIALLFAIYLVKPSPFCILDEIDAPLDDANIDRFTKIIQDFSTNTQFIVVTHNKRTMEAADTMYGVTMQEEGVSKLVSVRFNEDLNFAST